MKSPPTKVLEYFSLPQTGWQEPLHRGAVAKTWVGEKYVLQARPIQFVDRSLMLHKLAGEVDIQGLKFHGPAIVEEANGEVSEAISGACGDRVWDVQPRLYEVKSLFHPGMEDMELIQNADLVLSGVLEQLSGFALQVDQHQLFCQYDTPGIAIQKASPQTLKQFCRQTCPLPTSPADHLSEEKPESPLVCSHGDAIIKNTLLTTDGVCMIDWEAATVLPRHMDLAHMTVFLCKYAESHYWCYILDQHWEKVQAFLPGWDSQDWYLACAWYFVRELVAFQPSDPKVALRCWAGLADFVHLLKNA